MLFTIKGKVTGKTVIIESDYDSFLNQFYGCDEQPEITENGEYIVDDASLETTLREYPGVIVSES